MSVKDVSTYTCHRITTDRLFRLSLTPVIFLTKDMFDSLLTFKQYDTVYTYDILPHHARLSTHIARY